MEPQTSSTANREILLVDDEQAVLDGISRRLGNDYSLTLVNSPQAALELLTGSDRFAVILTDMQMPGMDGLTFIRRARELSSSSVFLMLTGNQDLPTATRALNEGQVFRYFTKPCASQDLRAGLDAAMRQWELLQAERELLQRTFVGSVNILCDIMGIAQPLLTIVNERMQRLIRSACGSLGWQAHWEYLVAAKLALIGFVVIKPDDFAKFLSGDALTGADKQLYLSALDTSSRLLAKIPRLERIAALVDRMRTTDGAIVNSRMLDGTCNVKDGGTLLGLAMAYVIGTRKYGLDTDANQAAEQLYPAPDEKLMNILREQDKSSRIAPNKSQQLHMSELTAGMVLAEDVNVCGAYMTLRAGDVLTEVAVAHLPTMPGMPSTLTVMVPS